MFTQVLFWVSLLAADESPSGRDCSSTQFTRNILSCFYQYFCLPSAFPHKVEWKPSRQMICMWSILSDLPRSQCRPFDSQFEWGTHTMKCFNFTSKGQDVTRAVACKQPVRWGGQPLESLLWFSSTEAQLRF